VVEIKNKVNCTGCGACANICPVNAISLQPDCDGFYYPKIDMDKCIHCDKCDQSCPMKNDFLWNENNAPKCFACALKDTEELFFVSSGGAFWALTQVILSQKGIVYGAVQNSVFDVHHMRAETLEEAASIRRSKYLQSSIGETYRQVKRDLDNNRIVLFSGTACQVSGLQGFLGKDYNSLVTCEVVCHGVPSIKAFQSYISELESKHLDKVKHIIFRDKSFGWKNNHIRIMFAKGEDICEPSVENSFHSAYLQGLFYRPSCGQCKFARIPRVADITLADYWQYNGELLENNNNRGISLVLCSTQKGLRALEQSRIYMDIQQTSIQDALKSCWHLNHSPKESGKRNQFFTALHNSGYEKAVGICNQKSFKGKIKTVVRKLSFVFKHNSISKRKEL